AVVRDGSFLAVAAEREEQAIRAREALTRSARWKEAASLPPTGEALYRQLMSSPAPADTVVEKTSSVAGAPVKTLEALYTRPYQSHGSIGPSCAVAQWQDGKLTVWTHSQGVFPYGRTSPRWSASSLQTFDASIPRARGAIAH